MTVNRTTTESIHSNSSLWSISFSDDWRALRHPSNRPRPHEPSFAWPLTNISAPRPQAVLIDSEGRKTSAIPIFEIGMGSEGSNRRIKGPLALWSVRPAAQL